MSERDGPNPAVVVAVAAILITTSVVVVAALSNSGEVRGDVTLAPDTGPKVTIADNAQQANLTQPFPDSNTLDWEADNGNMTISGDQVNVTVSDVEGTFTNISSLETGGTVRVNPDDKQTVKARNVDSLNFTSISVDDGNTDFVVSGTGSGTVNVSSLPATTAVFAVNSSGAFVGGGTTNSNGWGELSLNLSTHTVSLKTASSTSAPGISDQTPEGTQSDFPSTVSVNISDPDFPNDEVNVSFEHNGQHVGSENVTTDGGTASASVTSVRGENTVNVTARDVYGNVNTLNYTYSSPENLTIRESERPHDIIKDRQVNVTFFTGDQITERSTSNGNVSMDGLPIRDPIVAEVDAVENSSVARDLDPDAYFETSSVIITFVEQSNVYMLSQNKTAHNVTFTLSDQTGGKFEPETAQVLVQRQTNLSTMSSPQWENHYGNTFGAGGATATLNDGTRYRLLVRNKNNNTRVIGAYTPDRDEIVNLEVGSITAAPTDPGTEWAWNATYNAEGAENVRFAFNDTQDETTQIKLRVHERNNESNELVSNQTFTGPFGQFSFNEPVPQSQNETTWVVDVEVTRNGNVYDIEKPVGPRQPTLTGLPQRVKVIVSIGSILVVAGLFSRLNGYIGGLVVAALGGLFWYVDFLPKGTGIGVVVLAMVAAAIIFLRARTARGAAP